MGKIRKTPMISARGKVLYGLGDLGFSMIVNTVASFLMFFGTAVCGIPGTLMGIATALSTAWDAITDPIVGYISDHSKSMSFGRRHGFIFLSVFGMAIVNILLWNVPETFEATEKWIWILSCLLVYDVFTTFYATPNSALSVELSGDYNERTSIQSVRSVFMLIGTIVPIVLMSVLQAETGQYDMESYRNMAFITSSAMLFTGFIMFVSSYHNIPRLRAKAIADDKKEKFSLKTIFGNFFVVLKKPLYRNLILGYMISMMAVSFLTSAGMHVLTYTFHLQSTEMYGIIAGLFLMTIFSQPIWIMLVNKFDKKVSIMTGIVITLVGIALLFAVFIGRDTIPPESTALYILPALLLAGAGMGALYSMPTAMMGDAVAVEKYKTKVDNTGTYAGFMTLSNKLSQAATSLIIGVLLDLIGFEEGSPVQSHFVESGLGYIVIVGVAVTLLGGGLFYAKYTLKKSDVPNTDEDDFDKVVIKSGGVTTVNEIEEDTSYIEWE